MYRNRRYTEDEYRARYAVTMAIKHGRLVRPKKCESCGRTPARGRDGRATIQAHHHNGYDAEHVLDVTWICISCHRLAHKGPDEWPEARRLAAGRRSGSRTGWHHTEEARDKIRESRSRQVMPRPSAETRSRMSAARKAWWANRQQVDPD